MLTQAKNAPARLVFQTQAVPAAIAAIAFAAPPCPDRRRRPTGARSSRRIATGTDALARLLFDEYVLPFEVVSVLLLVAVVGGVYIAMRDTPERTDDR